MVPSSKHILIHDGLKQWGTGGPPPTFGGNFFESGCSSYSDTQKGIEEGLVSDITSPGEGSGVL